MYPVLLQSRVYSNYYHVMGDENSPNRLDFVFIYTITLYRVSHSQGFDSFVIQICLVYKLISTVGYPCSRIIMLLSEASDQEKQSNSRNRTRRSKTMKKEKSFKFQKHNKEEAKP